MPAGDFPPHFPKPMPAFTSPEGSAQRGDRLIQSLIQRISDIEVAVARLIGNPIANQQVDPTEGHAKWREDQVRGMIDQAALPPNPAPKWNGTPERIELCRYINDTPALHSLLYDLDLLPEQIKPETRAAYNMICITAAWKANSEASQHGLAKTEPAYNELEEGHKYLDKLGIPRLGEVGTLMIQGRIDWLDFGRGRVRPAVVWHDAKTDPPKVDGSYIAYRRDPSAADDRCAAWFDKDSGEWESECGEIIIPSPTRWAELPPPP